MIRNAYPTIDALWLATLRELVDYGRHLDSRVGGCNEIIGYSATLQDPGQNFLLNTDRKLSAPYAAAELLWYLSQKREIDGIVAYAPRYADFANDGIAHGAYGWRWASNPGFSLYADITGVPFSNQFDALLTLLKEKPNTRQAVVTMWDSGDLPAAVDGKVKDTPCTLALQFFVRDDKLDMVTYMRSNDVWLGLPYDVFCFTTIQHMVAVALELRMGAYTHQVGSMHLYDTNLERAQACIDMPVVLDKDMSYASYLRHMTPEECMEALCDPENRWCAAEQIARRSGKHTGASDVTIKNPRTMLDDLVLCCWHKTIPGFDARDYLHREALRGAIRG